MQEAKGFVTAETSTQEANNQLLQAQADVANAGSVVAPLAGHALSLFTSTVALQDSMSTDYMNQQVLLGTLTFGGAGPLVADSPDGFTYNNTAKLYWDPNASSGSKGHLDGEVIYNVYNQSKRYDEDFDFWATSQVGSVTPLKGSHIAEIDSAVEPNDDEELVESDPTVVNQEGSSGSLTLDASLAGEFKGASASVGLSRTWHYPHGYVGGGNLHNDEHYCEWALAGGADTGAKGCRGVETWKEPINEAAWWYIGSYAHWHS